VPTQGLLPTMDTEYSRCRNFVRCRKAGAGPRAAKQGGSKRLQLGPNSNLGSDVYATSQTCAAWRKPCEALLPACGAVPAGNHREDDSDSPKGTISESRQPRRLGHSLFCEAHPSC